MRRLAAFFVAYCALLEIHAQGVICNRQSSRHPCKYAQALWLIDLLYYFPIAY